jgi:hypothetical protein
MSHGTKSRRSPWVKGAVWSTLLSLGLAGVSGLPAVAQQRPAASAPSLVSMTLLSGVTNVDGTIVVIAVTSTHTLSLEGISPSTLRVLWSLPTSASAITLGEPYQPISIGGTVFNLVPQSDGAVYPEAVDAATGHVLWEGSQPGYAFDAPAVCAGNSAFCVSWVYTADIETGLPALLELAVGTGKTDRTVAGSERALGTNVYQTSATTATLMQIGSTGRESWRKTAASLFGKNSDNPNDGWNIDALGKEDVGSLGPNEAKGEVNLGDVETAGIRITNGDVAWRNPGEYNCMGVLEFLTAQVICHFTGLYKPVSNPNTKPSTKGMALTIEGFNTTTGAIHWSIPASDILPYFIGTGVAFRDATHVVIENAKRAYLILNTATGSTVTSSPSAVYWCESTPFVDVTAPAGSGEQNERAAWPRTSGCTDTGKASSSLPTTQPATTGVTVDGKYFWASSKGVKVEAAP